MWRIGVAMRTKLLNARNLMQTHRFEAAVKPRVPKVTKKATLRWPIFLCIFSMLGLVAGARNGYYSTGLVCGLLLEINEHDEAYKNINISMLWRSGGSFYLLCCTCCSAGWALWRFVPRFRAALRHPTQLGFARRLFKCRKQI